MTVTKRRSTPPPTCGLCFASRFIRRKVSGARTPDNPPFAIWVEKEDFFMKTASRSRRATFRLVLDAMLAALTVVFGLYVTIRIGSTLELSLTSLPILFAAFLFGPADAVTVALVSSFIKQVTLYGIGPTTVVWMLPSVLFALIAGLGALLIRRSLHNPVRQRLAGVILTVVAELIFTLTTTAVIYFDAWFFQYSVKAVSVLLPIRLGGCALRTVLTAFCVWFLLPRVQKLMSKRNLS